LSRGYGHIQQSIVRAEVFAGKMKSTHSVAVIPTHLHCLFPVFLIHSIKCPGYLIGFENLWRVPHGLNTFHSANSRNSRFIIYDLICQNIYIFLILA
jgi:hypothetical protein